MPQKTKHVFCYVTDRRALGSDPARLLEVISRALAAGVDWIQIREKGSADILNKCEDLSGRALLALVESAVEAARNTATKVFVNDRLDVAAGAGAAGVHLGAESLPVREAVDWCRQHAPGLRVGRSCHSLEEAQQAERDGAHYIFFGPVFSTPSKAQFGPPQGVEKLTGVCRSVRIPVMAIGGITLENTADCLRAGAAGIAAIRLFQEAKDLTLVAENLRSTR